MTNESHKYRIVLAFHGDNLENYDRAVALETKLETELLSGVGLQIKDAHELMTMVSGKVDIICFGHKQI